MMSLINLFVILALGATVVTLVLGLRSMVIGGDYDRDHSEKFMWQRVALQGVAVLLLVAATVMLNT
jgi:hypothetical protein